MSDPVRQLLDDADDSLAALYRHLEAAKADHQVAQREVNRTLRVLRRARRLLGRCIRCEEVAENGTLHCARHRKAMNEAAERWRKSSLRDSA